MGIAVLAVSLVTNYQYSPKRQASTRRPAPSPRNPSLPASPADERPVPPAARSRPDPLTTGGDEPATCGSADAGSSTRAEEIRLFAQAGEYSA